MKILSPLFLSVLSGILLFAAWPVSPFTFLIFVAFVPLLLLEDGSLDRSSFFGWTYLTLLLWNIGTTWWTFEASIPGGLLAIILNPLLMCIPWMGFHSVKKRMGAVAGYLSLIAFWLSFEYIHLNWQLSWPWLTLGNVFATHPGWVQWYEFTGAGGGSCWILLVNLVLFLLIKKRVQLPGSGKWYPILFIMLLIFPLVFSLLLGLRPPPNQSFKRPDPNIVIVQPDIDPYDKFAAGKEEAELQKLIQLSKSQIDSQTALVVWPETAIPISINEDSMRRTAFMAPVWRFLSENPRLSLFTGVEGYRYYNEKNKTSYSMRSTSPNMYEDSYNSAVLMDSFSFNTYHKSKLVPGVETIPSYLRFLEPIFEKFGGATGSYARQDDRTVLRQSNGPFHIAPAVCYESIYGEFISKYVRNGANLIVIITNDGWWGNTPGYKQHESYARLRAIETRKWVVRCANTGISCFISPYGDVYQAQGWDLAIATKMNVPISSGISFYAAHGDLIFETALLACGVLIVLNIIMIVKKRFLVAKEH
jgi:apolipoprotein N-acyltransferase